jgi:unsaturated chondroitin disaccharide hydrolase
MLKIDHQIAPSALARKIDKFWDLSASKLLAIERSVDPSQGAPVFTVGGKYTSRGWTEWTQGFQFGSSLLQFDAAGDPEFLELGRARTVERMASHVTHTGVHDHGFNNVSTYGNLLRLMNEGKIEENRWEREFYSLALKCSGAVQARRWTSIRTLRAPALAHRLGHVLMEENDKPASLLERLLLHARATATWSVYYGEGRDYYDVRGRVVHECVFNINDGNFRCPSSQQGYSPFSTWTRGLAWAICGFAELLEFTHSLPADELQPFGGRAEVEGYMVRAARATSDFYIENVPTDGIPYWDTGAPHLSPDALLRPADPYNDDEPVDSSAAAIAVQGLMRLGHYLRNKGAEEEARKYHQAGLTVLRTLLDEPYLSVDKDHQGLILHSVYHRPNGWDYVPPGRKVPCGESSMWGDYHAREAVLYVQRLLLGAPYLTFCSAVRA